MLIEICRDTACRVSTSLTYPVTLTFRAIASPLRGEGINSLSL